MERSVPPTTPNRAPWRIITRLAGTGRRTSAMSRATPAAAAIHPALESSGPGSVRIGTWSHSAIPNRTRKRTIIRPVSIQ